MVFLTINNPRTTTFNQFGGDVMNLVQSLFSAVNIAATDATNKPSIGTDFRFRSGRFILFDEDYSNEIKFVTPQLTANVNITFPASLTNLSDNEMVFNKATQTLEGKSISASTNVITGLGNGNMQSAAAIDWTKISKVGGSIGDFPNVNLTGLAHGYGLKWDSVTSKWIVYNIAGLTGETNTMTNLTGTTGSVGIFKGKVGVNFEMKKLNTDSSSVTITDDTANNEVDIGVIDATTALKGLVQLATFTQTTTGLAVQASDTRLSNARTPSTHATNHKSGGTDTIKVNELAAPTSNITTCNATISTNGLAPVLPNSSVLFWNGVGGWTEPVGTASGVSGNGSVLRNVSTKSGDGINKVFTIAHGMTITPTAYFVDPVTFDALGFFTKTVDATYITITYTTAPPSGTNNLKYSWVVFDNGNGSTLGEANTYSSVGTGALVTKTKVGVDFPFRSLFAGSTKISITQNTNDVSFDVNQANLAIAWSQITSVPTTLVDTNQTNTYGAFAQIFPSTQLKILNPENTFYYHIAGSSITANRTVTLPLIAGADEFVTKGVTQTLEKKTLLLPVIAAIKNSTYEFAIPSPSGANDTAVGRNTTDTMINKTLTLPIIAAIKNGTFNFTIPTLTANETAVGKATTDTITNKTFVLANNTLTDTSAVAGDIAVHDGTKFVRQAKGADGSFLGVSSGSVGYFTPSTGSGGVLPDGSAPPSTGRWGALWGGSLSGDGIFNPIVTYNTITYVITSPSGAAVELYTSNVDDAIAEIKIPAILARQSNIKLKIRCAPRSSSGSVLQFGLASVAALPIGGSHDNPLNNASGVMLTCSQDIESFWQVSRNSGGVSQVKEATTIASNNSNVHTFEFDINTTNCIVSIDGVVVGTYTTSIPALTTPLYIYAHVEAIGATARGIQVRYIQVTCL